MKYLTIILVIILFLAGNAVKAQELTQTIKGTVIDKQSQFELPGVNIVVVGSDPIIGGATGIDGKFRLENVPIGRHTIQVSFMGYETVTLSNLTVNSGKELDLNIELEEQVTKLEAVVITAQDDKRESLNKMSTVSARTFSIEEAGRYSGSLQDPARMAQNFAGVSGASDDRNDIIIRGNSPTGVLWRMEGIDIPSPNHFSTLGTTGGPVSMLNINNLKNSDFMTSAFSAEYGNALSGVFDLQLRNGNNDKREYLAQMGFNGVEFGAEGPFKKEGKASYLINYRYSFLGIFKALGLDLGTGGAVPQYQDVTFKLNLPTEKAGRFTVFGLGGTSYIDFKAEEAGDNNLYSGDSENSQFTSTTGIVGASHTYFFNEKTYSKLVVAGSLVRTEGLIDSLSSTDGHPERITGFDRQQYKYSANYKLNRKFNAKNSANVGVIFDRYQFDMIDTVLDGSQYRTLTNLKDGAFLMQSYLQWQHKFSDKLTMNTGLHTQHLLYNKTNAVEPRFGLKYKGNERHTLSFGAGLHSQLQPVIVYFIEEEVNNLPTLPNKNLDFSKSAHFVFGHDFLIGNDIRLKTELYYQHLFNVPVDTFSSAFSMLNEGADFLLPDRTGLINEGTGYNYGVEVTLEKFFSKGYYFLLTSSVFQSKYEGSDGVERNTPFNSNYVFNLLGGKEFNIGKNKTLSFDTKITYAGGRRYTPIDLQLSQQFNSEVRLYDQSYASQYDPYFRADFKVTFRMNGEKVAQQFSIDLQNISGQQNVFLHGYNNNSGQIATTYQRGFFPDVQYKIFF
jgi:hypothetical protein